MPSLPTRENLTARLRDVVVSASRRRNRRMLLEEVAQEERVRDETDEENQSTIKSEGML